MLRMFGDGLTHVSPVWSNQLSRSQYLMSTMVRSAPIFLSALKSSASSPSVMPCRTGIG